MNVINETLSSISPGDLVVFVYRHWDTNELTVVPFPSNPELDAYAAGEIPVSDRKGRFCKSMAARDVRL